jgi:hypothetical protein
MAFVVPIATAVGGGSAAAGGILLASAAAGIYAGVESARMTRQMGRVAEGQSKIDAAAEGDAARQREILRKRALMRAISSQQARAGAGGVEFSGSIGQIAQLDIDEANRDLMIDRANTSQRQRALRLQGRNARVTSRAQSTISLLDTVATQARSLTGNL